MNDVVLGIDLGTQGVRILAVTASGQVLAAAHQSLPTAGPVYLPGWLEQSPQDWWTAAKDCLRQVTAGLPDHTPISGICVDSTSGTILPVDAGGEPLHPALMYNDSRSEGQVPAVQRAGAEHQKKHSFVFGSSYALPKLLWFLQERPEIYARTWRFLHAADFIVAKLSGRFDITDTSNALKTGYDLVEERWPEFIETELGISLEKLPQVVLPGTRMTEVSQQAAQEAGIQAGIPLFAGATDGTAAQVASGAAQPGEWNTTLGTTLVFKGISKELIPDPLGRVYFHRHPEGWWMPGGASNTGTDWMLRDHPGADLNELNRQASRLLPTAYIRYPLCKKGERFPFVYDGARGFIIGEPTGEAERYACGLEGVGLVERLAYQTLQEIGLQVANRVYITGGGSKSEVWSQLRASILNKTLVQPAVTETAFGSAVIAASGCWYGKISAAARSMVKIERTFEPALPWLAPYEKRYAAFRKALSELGYLRGQA